MANALDNLVSDVEQLVCDMGANVPQEPQARSWYVSIAAQYQGLASRLKEAIAKERKDSGESIAFDLLEKYANTPDDKLTESAQALKHKLLCIGSSASRENHGRFNTFDGALRTYMFETGKMVCNKSTFEKFGQWLYAKRCDDACPFYRIVEGEGECRPRCTNTVGHCTTNE